MELFFFGICLNLPAEDVGDIAGNHGEAHIAVGVLVVAADNRSRGRCCNTRRPTLLKITRFKSRGFVFSGAEKKITGY